MEPSTDSRSSGSAPSLSVVIRLFLSNAASFCASFTVLSSLPGLRLVFQKSLAALINSLKSLSNLDFALSTISSISSCSRPVPVFLTESRWESIIFSIAYLSSSVKSSIAFLELNSSITFSSESISANFLLALDIDLPTLSLSFSSVRLFNTSSAPSIIGVSLPVL